MILYTKTIKEASFKDMDDFYKHFPEKFNLSEEENMKFREEVNFIKYVFKKDMEGVKNFTKIIYLLQMLEGVYGFNITDNGNIFVYNTAGVALRYDDKDNKTAVKEFLFDGLNLIENKGE